MIALDSSVVINLLADGPNAEADEHAIRQALSAGPVVVCDVVLAEVCTALRNGSEVLEALEDIGVQYATVDRKAALRAGEMQRRYRQKAPDAGERSISDFLVGAHALLQCDGLITDDQQFYRDYFKGLKIIVPQAP